jgi:hypothetical protein
MELEALHAIDSEVRGLGARIVTLTPEFERYTRDVHRKLNLTLDILTDLHLKTAERPLQVGRHYAGPVPRRDRISLTDAGTVRDRQGGDHSRGRCERRLHGSSGSCRDRPAIAHAS